MPSSPIDISLVTYNSSRWLPGFIASLQQQTYPLSCINLYVQDNGSTEDEYEAMKQLLSPLMNALGKLVLERGENRGFGHGHNQNLRRSCATLFLVTNVDIEFLPESISRIIAVAEGDDTGVACWEFRQQPYEHPKLYDPVTLETPWCSSACILFRRTSLERVGGYDEKIFLYGEDVELSYRLRDHGFVLKYCPRAVCLHHTYTEANEIKPAQFFGSTLANLLIRLRFGTVSDCFVGMLLFLSLWFVSPQLPRKYACLARNTWRALKDAPYFLRTHKRSDIAFEFNRWDYTVCRDGAFYARPELPSPLPRVSIIVRTYAGRTQWLSECLSSLANQTYPHIEVVVVEDGSREAAQLIDEVQKSGRFDSLIYVPIAKAGRCHAGNVGLESASGELIGFLDDDDLFFADHVETLVAELNAHPECELAYAVGIAVGTRVLSNQPLHYEAIFYSVTHRQPFSRTTLWHHNYIPIQTALFRRSLYQRHGGLDTTLDNLEDWNLWTRFSMDASFQFADKATSLYRVPADKQADLARQRKLDEFYEKAVAKQKDMRASLSPPELMDYFHEFAQNYYVFAVSHSRIRKILVSYPVLRSLLWPARIASNIIRRLRTRKSS